MENVSSSCLALVALCCADKRLFSVVTLRLPWNCGIDLFLVLGYEMMTATFSVSAECPHTVDAHSRRATNQDNAHQRHTRSVQSSS